MGDKRPKGEKEYNPLDDAVGLIGSVLSGSRVATSTEPLAQPSKKAKTKKEDIVIKKVDSTKKNQPKEQIRDIKLTNKEEMKVCKFKIPKSEYNEIKKLLMELSELVDARIDFSNLGRGWVTRLITAQKELLDATINHEKLKTANSRDALSIADIDHAMATIQSVAFRRAQKV